MNRDDEDWRIERAGEYLSERPELEPVDKPRRPWSIFDIFRRDREDENAPDEPKRKRHAKELKKAAKIHARDVITPEPNETADDIGRKVKRRWREQLFERSRRHATQLRQQETNGPLSGYQVAQLMVAERLLQLDHFLHTPALPKAEKKAIKTSIDFLGLLSDKLENPTHIMPPEIENIYEHITAETEPLPEATDAPEPITAATEQETDQKLEPESAKVSEQIPPTDPQPSAKPNAQSKPAHVGQPSAKPTTRTMPPPPSTQAPPSRPPAVTPPTSSSPPQSEAKPADEPPKPKRYGSFVARLVKISQAAADKPLIAVPGPGLPIDTLRQPSRTLNETASPLVSSLSKPSRAPTRPSPTPRTAAVGPDVIESPNVTQRMEKTVAAAHNLTSLSPQVETASLSQPNKPFVFWSTTELLREAATISIGPGHYLQRAYQSGEIDRDGLISVIKAYQRGQNHQLKYRELRELYRLRRQTGSLEAARSTIGDAAPPPMVAQPHSSPPDKTIPSPQSVTKQPSSVNDLLTAIRQRSLSGQRKNVIRPITELIIAIALSAAVIGVLFLTL